MSREEEIGYIMMACRKLGIRAKWHGDSTIEFLDQAAGWRLMARGKDKKDALDQAATGIVNYLTKK